MKFVGRKVVIAFHNRYSLTDKADDQNKDANTTKNVGFKVTDFNTVTVKRKKGDCLD